MSDHHQLPHRSATTEAVPDEDVSYTSRLLVERLEAWRHACVYLEDYISATEKVHKAHAKEYEKILKTISTPLKERHHFDQSTGGIGGMFENMKANTEGIAHVHAETEKILKDSVLPILHKLHQEIQAKIKDVSSSAAKDLKHVDKARSTSQHWIELLGQHVTTWDAPNRKVDPSTDPYVVQRHLYHQLNKQILEENKNLQDLVAVQETFQRFEAHVLESMQRAMSAFVRAVSAQADRTRALYGDMASACQRIPHDFEWRGFLRRHNNALLDPDTPSRTIDKVSFPNQNHPSTQPLIAGTLQRKSRLAVKGYHTGFYVVTPSKYLHEFKDNDIFNTDPSPDFSLHLPDCTIGTVAGLKFTVKGKDVAGSKIGTVLATRHDVEFKAQSPEDAERWWQVIRDIATHDSSVPDTTPPGSELSSPVDRGATTHGAMGSGHTGVGNDTGLVPTQYPAGYPAGGEKSGLVNQGVASHTAPGSGHHTGAGAGAGAGTGPVAAAAASGVGDEIGLVPVQYPAGYPAGAERGSASYQ